MEGTPKNNEGWPIVNACWFQEEVKEFEYVYTQLFRVVPPYRFEFGTSIKERWIGRPLVEVFAQEFPYFEDSLAYYTEAMTLGRLRVNDEVTPLDYRCRDGDVITHIVHRSASPRTMPRRPWLLPRRSRLFPATHVRRPRCALSARKPPFALS